MNDTFPASRAGSGIPTGAAGPGPEAWPPAGWTPRRIVVLHLDSLCCLPAMNRLFEALGPRVVLVVSSDRFAGFGGFLRQFQRNVSHSGLRLTVALGFDIVALRIASFFAPLTRLVGRRSPWRNPRELAVAAGAAFRVVTDINDAAACDAIRGLRPDLVISLHFDQILRAPFLAAAACPVVNIHPALLPSHRGPCPAFWTLAAGDTTCGVTVHRIVDETIDTGPAVARRARPVPAGRCMGELDEMLFADGVEALLGVLSGQGDLVLGAAGGSPGYEGFPDRAAVRRARRAGVRLWRLWHAVRLIGALLGWLRPVAWTAK